MTVAYYSHERPELVNRIEPGPDNVVLDLGCGLGGVSSAIRRSGRAGEIWGVEVVPEIAEKARENPDLDRVFSGDLEKVVHELPDGYFTHILAGDVLEHLVDPWETLANLRRRLRPGGRIVCSIPNIRNFSFIAKLLFAGTFEYRDSGVMDRTHLRFFARGDTYRMFEQAGFRQIEIVPARPKRNPGYHLARAVFGDLVIKSLLVRATNPGDSA
jgi:2-polyprenyl-3-methyl-5-hydroxy-6-metoxy-1,4-benzoquinol methylase